MNVERRERWKGEGQDQGGGARSRKGGEGQDQGEGGEKEDIVNQV